MNAKPTAQTTPAAATTDARAPRRPATATQRARLAEAGVVLPADATPADLKAAWFAAFAHDGKAWTRIEPAAEATPEPTPAQATPTPDQDGGKGERSDSPAHRQNAKPKPATQAAPKPAPANFPLCGCGCGVPTVTAKARFLSGHDARWAGMVGRGEVTLNLADPDHTRLVTPALLAKIDKIAATQATRDAQKAARTAAKAAAKAAYDAAMATA